MSVYPSIFPMWDFKVSFNGVEGLKMGSFYPNGDKSMICSYLDYKEGSCFSR